MKKAIFILAAFAAVGFTSCRKDYTCVCKDDSTGITTSTTTIHTKKSLASSECSLNDTYYTTCTIQ